MLWTYKVSFMLLSKAIIRDENYFEAELDN